MSRARLDTSTARGRHVEQRLREDPIAWLTTVRPSGQPDSVPVWFWWDGERLLVWSRPDAQKLRNLTGNPRVSFVLDDTRGGADVVRVEGTAVVDERHPGAHTVAGYVAKYGERMRRIGYADAEEFAADYRVTVVITPTRWRV